jgi:hypothetical protein
MAKSKYEEEWVNGDDQDEEWIDSPQTNGRKAMDTYGYTGPYRFRPLSPWAYVGYALLFSIPVIGWLILIIFTFSRSNINRRSFARSYWCFLFLIVCFIAICFYVPALPSLFTSRNLTMTFNNAKPFVLDAFHAGNSDNEKVAEPSATTSPEKSSDQESEESPTVSSSDANSNAGSLSAAVTPEFKEAMDSYEAFFDKYIRFMKQYEKSNNDVGMMIDYASFLTQYADMIQKLEAIDDNELSMEDSAYYLKITTRIYKKLAEISSQK